MVGNGVGRLMLGLFLVVEYTLFANTSRMGFL